MKSWSCIENCGACCHLDLAERDDLSRILSSKDIDLINSMTNKDGWCKYLDKSNKKCRIYESRPHFCRVSEFTKKLTEKFHNNFNKPNIVINNSVPLDKFKSFGNDKRNQLKIKENEFVIIVSGTWRRHKRLEEIIKFFLRLEKKIENLRLLVLGNVSREERLVSNKIIFAGNVNHDELPEWYRAGQLYTSTKPQCWQVMPLLTSNT